MQCILAVCNKIIFNVTSLVIGSFSGEKKVYYNYSMTWSQGDSGVQKNCWEVKQTASHIMHVPIVIVIFFPTALEIFIFKYDTNVFDTVLRELSTAFLFNIQYAKMFSLHCHVKM